MGGGATFQTPILGDVDLWVLRDILQTAHESFDECWMILEASLMNVLIFPFACKMLFTTLTTLEWGTLLDDVCQKETIPPSLLLLLLCSNSIWQEYD